MASNYTSWMQNGPSDPTPGDFDSPNVSIDNGGGSPPASTPITVPTTGNDYNGWNWEQTLVGVLGLHLPDRNDVTSQRWTAINFNSDGGSGLLRIFAATWMSGADNQDIFVYLNPNLLQPNGIWDNYFNQPYQAITDAVQENYTGIQVDPLTFAIAAAEVQGVIDFYQNSSQTLQGLSNSLQGDASAFQGQAGGAFAQLVNNLYEATNSVAKQMTTPSNYATLISAAEDQVRTFVLSLWNAMAHWIAMLDHQPLGAIYQALENGNVITVDSDGNYQMATPNSTDSSFGDLTTADAWLAIESSAKQLWLQSIASALDPIALTALTSLANSYLSAASGDQPLNPPTLQQITVGNSVNDDLADDTNLPSLDLSGDTGQLDLGGDGNLDVPGEDNTPDSVTTGLGSLGGLDDQDIPGGSNVPGGVDTALGDAGGTGNLNVPGGVSTTFDGNGGAGGTSGPSAVGELTNALAANGKTQSALQQALALAPSTGPLHNALTTALANNSKARGALQAALNGTETAATALQAALSSNGQTESALRQALTLAPSKGPLHNALETALGDSKKTQSALNQTLASGAVPGTSSIHQALNSDNAVSGALQKALLSSLVPSRGPLHTTLTSALARSGEIKSDLDHALDGGATPSISALHHALSSNTALVSELRSAIGQVPAHGALHNELMAALADSKHVGTQIHQAMAQAGVASQSPAGLDSSLGNPAGALTGPYSALGKQGLTATLGGADGGGASGLSAAPGGGIGGGGGLSLVGHGGASAVASTPGLGGGASVADASGSVGSSSAAGPAASPGSGGSAVPFFPPMAGSSGMGTGSQQQERERTTWLAEKEDVWGTEPQVGPAVLGRDFFAADDDADDELDEAMTGLPARGSSRIKAR